LALGSKTLIVGEVPPKSVVREYFEAADKGDLATLQRDSASDAANQFSAEMMCRTVALMRVVTKAAADKFGNVVVGPNRLPLNLVRLDTKMIDDGVEKIDGEAAKVFITIPNTPAAIAVPLKREDGAWKMDLDSFLKMPIGNPAFVDGIREILTEMESEAKRIADDISAGTFPTWDAAYASAKTRLDETAKKKIAEVAERVRKQGKK
jgi:hypothetical protein